MPRRSLPVSVLLMLGLFGGLGAQNFPERPGGTFRTSIGLTPLLAADRLDPMSLMATERIPSGRATLDIQVTPRFGVQFGGLRIAGPDEALWAGIAGIRYNLLSGRLRVAPFLDGGYGPMEARVDSGGYYYLDDAGQEQYRPFYRPVSGPAYGGGGGIHSELILGPGLTIQLLGGYYHFLSSAGPELSRPFLGAGLRLSFRHDRWYWRSSGRDKEPPLFVVLDPAPDGDGRLALQGRSLKIAASDLSGVEHIWVNGNAVQLNRATGIPADVEQALIGYAVEAEAYIDLVPGQNSITVVLQDGAGNIRRERLESVQVVAKVPAPSVNVVTPSVGSPVEASEVLLVGYVSGGAGVVDIRVDGNAVTVLRPGEAVTRGLTQEEDEARTYFEHRVALVPGANEFLLEATDASGNRTTTSHSVTRRVEVAATPAVGAEAGPTIRVEEPREWSGAGLRGIGVAPKSSIRVVGTAQHPVGVREIRINGQLAALQSLAPNNTVVRFVGFAGVESSSGEIEVAAWSSVGDLGAKLFRYRADPTLSRTTESVASAAGGFGGERYAVVIGISEYRDPGIPNLQYADEDARAFYDFLISDASGLGGLRPENVKLLVDQDATYREMRSALNTFLERATDNDIVYIFIAGHGAPNPNRPDDLYILPFDAESSDLAGTAYPMSDVNESIRRLYARHTVLITDACHSGGVGMGGFGTRAASDVSLNAINQVFLEDLTSINGGLAIFTASEARQLSREGVQWGGGHGVFTYHLLQGLRGEADADQDQIVRLGELMEYVRDAVRRETRNAQIPSIGSQSHDRFLPMSIVGPPGR